LVSTEEIDSQGQTIEGVEQVEHEQELLAEVQEVVGNTEFDDEPHQPRKYYVRGGKAEIDSEVTYDLAGVKPAPRHAELAVNLAGSMATFLIATWEGRSGGERE
jgi:hypothetical protein